MHHLELEQILNQLLSSQLIKDYCPNGLQVEGKPEVTRIITGVTASQALIDKAIEHKADAILVHHGYFWKGEPEAIRGMKGNRLRQLIKHDINLFAYHLPLDMHPEIGNNAQLAQRLNIHVAQEMANKPQELLLHGELEQALSGEEFAALIESALSRKPLHIAPDQQSKKIKSVGLCTGGGQDFITQAVEMGLDAFISGEISERTTYVAREMGIHYYSAGHHATERYGIKALGEWLAQHYKLEVEFIDIDNPV